MLWNPSSNVAEGVGFNVPGSGIPIDWRLGGKHFVYVFRNNVVEDNLIDQGVPMDFNDPTHRQPAYDAGMWMASKLNSTDEDDIRDVYRSCMWVGFPLLAEGASLLSSDATIRLRVERPYERYGTGDWLSRGDALIPGVTYLVDKGPVVHNGERYERGEAFKAVSASFDTTATNTTSNPGFDVQNEDINNLLVETENGGMPLYTFSLDDLAATFNEAAVAEDMLDEIYAVPNPYYAYSEYEGTFVGGVSTQAKLDNRIRIINLPQTCTVSIYAADGVLVRRFQKDDPTITSLDWDLKNQVQVPIASGAYIIHIDVPDVGEKVIKWFGVLRPIDLDSF
jgi:hypothetical protein